MHQGMEVRKRGLEFGDSESMTLTALTVGSTCRKKIEKVNCTMECLNTEQKHLCFPPVG